MVSLNPSENVVAALKQLQQFAVISDGADAVCALSGVRVAAIEDPGDSGSDMVTLTFPGGSPVQVIGTLYLKLKVIESVRLEMDSVANGVTRTSQRVGELFEHLRHKYGL